MLLESVVVSSGTAVLSPSDIVTATTDTVVPMSSLNSAIPLALVGPFEVVLELLSMTCVSKYNVYHSYTVYAWSTRFSPYIRLSSSDLVVLVIVGSVRLSAYMLWWHAWNG